MNKPHSVLIRAADLARRILLRSFKYHVSGKELVVMLRQGEEGYVGVRRIVWGCAGVCVFLGRNSSLCSDRVKRDM